MAVTHFDSGRAEKPVLMGRTAGTEMIIPAFSTCLAFLALSELALSHVNWNNNYLLLLGFYKKIIDNVSRSCWKESTAIIFTIIYYYKNWSSYYCYLATTCKFIKMGTFFPSTFFKLSYPKSYNV